jgi:alpha-tubulin suppressor-like RCC1 family protein
MYMYYGYVTDDGKVLTWGRGGDGQLGHGSWGNGKTPQVVEALAHLRIVYIACGSFSTAAITGKYLIVQC